SSKCYKFDVGVRQLRFRSPETESIPEISTDRKPIIIEPGDSLEHKMGICPPEFQETINMTQVSAFTGEDIQLKFPVKSHTTRLKDCRLVRMTSRRSEDDDTKRSFLTIAAGSAERQAPTVTVVAITVPSLVCVVIVIVVITICIKRCRDGYLVPSPVENRAVGLEPIETTPIYQNELPLEPEQEGTAAAADLPPDDVQNPAASRADVEGADNVTTVRI
ncbi:hypothetical protein BaRGS_00038548, partial [Batillaria attramentaria]